MSFLSLVKRGATAVTFATVLAGSMTEMSLPTEAEVPTRLSACGNAQAPEGCTLSVIFGNDINRVLGASRGAAGQVLLEDAWEGVYQSWSFVPKGDSDRVFHVRNRGTGTCLARQSSAGQVGLEECDSKNYFQQWNVLPNPNAFNFKQLLVGCYLTTAFDDPGLLDCGSPQYALWFKASVSEAN